MEQLIVENGFLGSDVLGYNSNIDTSPYIIHCTEKNGKLKLMSDHTQCREIFLSYIRKYNVLGSDLLGKLPTNKFEFLMVNCVTHDEDGFLQSISSVFNQRRLFVERTKNALALVNAIEDKYGWQRSIIKEVIVKNRPGVMAFYVKASKRWKRSPHLASLYILLLRSARQIKMEPFKTVEEALNQFDINSDIHKLLPYWPILLEKYQQIFRGLSHKKLYSIDIITKSSHPSDRKLVKAYAGIKELSLFKSKMCDFLFDEGIRKLCVQETRYRLIKQRLISYKSINDNEKKRRKSRHSNIPVSYAK